ncbi:MAG: cell division topological specificity factor MinE, partial [Gluconacetobacter diazotrophicus]|nr:cell division topological specificity factor MinE [Gluconacetobacter diazotrophicus]
MSFLSQLFAKRSSAPVARDRLQILLAHERANGGAGGEGHGELIAKLREEILEVIARHVPIDRDKVQIKLDRGAAVSTLEIDVEMPALKDAAKKAAAGKAKPDLAVAQKVEPEKTGPKQAEPEKAEKAAAKPPGAGSVAVVADAEPDTAAPKAA